MMQDRKTRFGGAVSGPTTLVAGCLVSILLLAGPGHGAAPARAADCPPCRAALAKKPGRRLDDLLACLGGCGSLTPDERAGFLVLAGNEKRRRGDFPAAVDDYSRALDAVASHAPALAERGWARAIQGEYGAAAADFGRSLQAAPSAHAHQGLAWMLATARDPDVHDARAAVGHARQAVDLTRGLDPSALDTLAAALARAGDFAAAVAVQKRALDLAEKQGDPLRLEYADRLALYRDNRPYTASLLP